MKNIIINKTEIIGDELFAIFRREGRIIEPVVISSAEEARGADEIIAYNRTGISYSYDYDGRQTAEKYRATWGGWTELPFRWGDQPAAFYVRLSQSGEVEIERGVGDQTPVVLPDGRIFRAWKTV